MLLWHTGVAAALTYVTLGRRRVDYRFVLGGAIAPDIVDGIAGAFGAGSSGRWIGHSLLAALAVAVVVVVVVRDRNRRLAVFGLAVGWLMHLVADAMWQAPETFLWPAFGADFAGGTGGEPYSWDLLMHPGRHLAAWLGEIAGAALLAWFWIAFRFGERGRFRAFLRDGYLRP